MIPEQVKNYITGTYSEAEEQFAKEWIGQDAERKELVAQLRKVWEESESLRQLNDQEIDCAWRSVRTKMGQGITVDVKIDRARSQNKKKSVKSWSSPLLKLAAVLLLGFGLFTILQQHSEEDVSEQAEVIEKENRVIKAAYGEQVRFRLNDQSVVTLNGGSEVSFSANYSQENREIELLGEAYFEVNNAGQEHPFIVLTEKAVITDIGTSFNVNAYPEKETTDIVVADGEIEVRLNTVTPGPTVNLKEGDMVKVEGTEEEILIEKVDLDLALGWMKGRLVFENERFESIVYRLERFYNIDVEITQDSLKKERISATFENEQLERVLAVLAISLDADFEIKGSKVVIFTN